MPIPQLKKVSVGPVISASPSQEKAKKVFNTEEMMARLGIKSVAEEDPTLKIMAYGKSGTGKTTFASTFPKPILFLQCDKKGVISIRRRKDTYFKQVDTWEDFEEAFNLLKDDDGNFYKTVVLDTVTSWQEVVMASVYTGAGMITQQTWGKCSSKMKTWLTNLIDLPLNVVILAQDRMAKTEASDDMEMIMPEVGAYTMPSVSKILNAAVSVIGQTYIKASWIKPQGQIAKRTLKTEYCLRIGPHTQYITKVRRDILSEDGSEKPAPEYLVNPTYEKLMEVILGEDDKFLEEIKMRKKNEEEIQEKMTLSRDMEE